MYGDTLSSTFTAAIVGLLFITCNAFQREIADFFSNHHVPPGLVPANKTGFYDPLAPYVAPALSTIVSKAVSAASEGHSLFSDYVSDVSEDISVDMSMLIHPRATPFNPLPPPDDTSSLPTTTTTPSSLLPLPTSTESDAAPPTADPSDVIPHSPGKDEYRLYTGNGSIAAGWPHKADWMSYEAMFTTNIPLILHSCKIWHVAPNTLPEIHSIHTATLTISHATNTDARFILAIILQESNGCVRVPTSFYSLRNPGLMQSHNGPATCNEDASPVYPCPYETIEEMIREGTAGTFEGRGMGLVMALRTATTVEGGVDDVGRYYRAARVYNSGSVDASGDLGKGVATHCYASDVANRLTGWSLADDGCTEEMMVGEGEGGGRVVGDPVKGFRVGLMGVGMKDGEGG